MHNGERHTAHYGGSWCLLLKYGGSQGNTFKPVGTSYNPSASRMGFCLCLFKLIFYVCVRLAQSYFCIRQTWIFNYFEWKMCYFHLAHSFLLVCGPMVFVKYTDWDLMSNGSHFYTHRLFTYTHTRKQLTLFGQSGHTSAPRGSGLLSHTLPLTAPDPKGWILLSCCSLNPGVCFIRSMPSALWNSYIMDIKINRIPWQLWKIL